jgi:hypothetical protein
MPHERVKVGDTEVPLWFLDGKNKVGKEFDFRPMSEGIAAYGKWLAALCESGAEIYQKDGQGLLDSVIFLTLPARKE